MAKNKEKTFKGSVVEVRYPPNPTDEQKSKAFNKALSKFKKIVQDEGIIQEYRKRQFYEKPSVVRNRKKAMAKKRWQKKQKEMRQERGW